jgi:hypothetical protein
MGPTATSHTKEGVLWIFIALKNPSPRPGFDPAILGSSGKHTEATTVTVSGKLVHVDGVRLCL